MIAKCMLDNRQLLPEEMDDPALSSERLFGALDGLRRLNIAAASARIVWSPIKRLARSIQRPLRVLDIATGAGDIPIALWRRAKRARIELELHAIDINARSIDFARKHAEQAQANVSFSRLDALNDGLPTDFDIVMCSLFLHHLTTEDATKLLERMNAAATWMGLASDLRRNAAGLVLAYAASRIFTRSQVVHGDAVQSVRAAFTRNELAKLAREAALPNFRINNRWPCRMLLTWQAANEEAGPPAAEP